jgi:anti-sigma regulatory factor (Ser/Thr protein kinase)
MEELFVNMVKYNPDVTTDIEVEMSVGQTNEVTVTLTDNGGVEFDVTAKRPVDIEAPLEERTPGGLGVHLIQNLVDSLQYRYKDGRGKVIFTKRSENEDV